MQEQQKILSLLQTGTPDNWELAQQLAQACSISLLEILQPYQELAQLAKATGEPTLEDYQQLFSKPSFICIHKGVKNIPTTLSHLTHLTNISFPNNQLTHIEQLLFDFPQLKVLVLADNQLQHFPSTLDGWETLQVLILSSNNIPQLPPSIGQLQQLKQCYLSNNQLQQLPNSIGQLQQLQSLQLRNNNLHTLPKEFYQLNALKFLNLDNNPLQVDWLLLSNLQNLISLDLSNIALPRSSYEKLKIALPKTTITVSEGYLY